MPKTQSAASERGGGAGLLPDEIAGFEMLNGVLEPRHLIGQMIELAAALQTRLPAIVARQARSARYADRASAN